MDVEKAGDLFRGVIPMDLCETRIRAARSHRSALDDVVGWCDHFVGSSRNSASKSETRQARRPLIRIGRIGPLSRQAHFRRVCGRRLRADAAASVESIAGSETSLGDFAGDPFTLLKVRLRRRALHGVDGVAISMA